MDLHFRDGWGLFAHRGLISTAISLCCNGEPMEPGFVPTRAEEFVIFVDERAGLGPHVFEDLQAFLVAEEAVVCPACFLMVPRGFPCHSTCIS